MKYTLPLVTGGPIHILGDMARRPEIAFFGQRIDGKRLIELGALVAKARSDKFLIDGITPGLKNVLAETQLFNGFREAPYEGIDDWSDVLDAAVDTFFEDYEVSADFHGQHTIDSRLDADGGIEQCAKAFADDVWKGLILRIVEDTNGERKVEQLTPAKIMSAIGLVESDLVEAFTPKPGEKVEIMAQRTLTEVMNTLHAAHGHNVEGIKGMIELALDTDMDLAQLGCQQLGLNAEDAATFQKAKAEQGATVETLCATLLQAPFGDNAAPSIPAPVEEIDVSQFMSDSSASVQLTDMSQFTGGVIAEPDLDMSAFTGGATGVEGPGAATEKPKGRRGRPAANAGPSPAGTIPAEALKLVRENTNVKSEEIALLLGISRQSFDNYVKDKGKFVADPAQKAALLAFVTQRRDGLVQAAQMIEAT